MRNPRWLEAAHLRLRHHPNDLRCFIVGSADLMLARRRRAEVGATASRCFAGMLGGRVTAFGLMLTRVC